MNNREKLKTVTVRLPESSIQLVKNLAEAQGKTISEVVDDALQMANSVQSLGQPPVG